MVTTPMVIDGRHDGTLRGLRIRTGSGARRRGGRQSRGTAPASCLDGLLSDRGTAGGSSSGLGHGLDLRDSELTDNADALEVKSQVAPASSSAGNQIHDNPPVMGAPTFVTGVAMSYVTGPADLLGEPCPRQPLAAGQPADGVGIEVYASTGLTSAATRSSTTSTRWRPVQTPHRPHAGCGSPATSSTRAGRDRRGPRRHPALRVGQPHRQQHLRRPGHVRRHVIDGTLGTPFGGSIAGLVVRDNIVVYGRA